MPALRQAGGQAIALPADVSVEAQVDGMFTEMFKQLTPASDLDMRYGIDAPTVRIDGMTLAGT